MLHFHKWQKGKRISSAGEHFDIVNPARRCSKCGKYEYDDTRITYRIKRSSAHLLPDAEAIKRIKAVYIIPDEGGKFVFEITNQKENKQCLKR